MRAADGAPAHGGAAREIHEIPMYIDFANVLVFSLFGIVFVVLNVSVVSRLLRPRVEDEEKLTTYECGEPPVGESWVRFDIRFYAVALVFLIFDVEVAFLYPWGVVFRELAQEAGLFVFLEMVVFVGILLVGFVYVWVKGDLDWIKSAASHALPGERRGAAGEDEVLAGR